MIYPGRKNVACKSRLKRENNIFPFEISFSSLIKFENLSNKREFG